MVYTGIDRLAAFTLEALTMNAPAEHVGRYLVASGLPDDDSRHNRPVGFLLPQDFHEPDCRYPLRVSGRLSEASQAEVALAVAGDALVTWLQPQFCERRGLTIFQDLCAPHEIHLQAEDDYGERVVTIDILPIGSTGCVLNGECWQAEGWCLYQSLIQDAMTLFGDPARAARLPDEAHCNEIVEFERRRLAAGSALGRYELVDEWLELATAVLASGQNPIDYDTYLVAIYRDRVYGKPWVCLLPERRDCDEKRSKTEPLLQLAGTVAEAPDEGPGAESPPSGDPQDPLACIPNERERKIARLWRQKYTAAEIGKEIAKESGGSFGAATVTNILSRLRGDHGKDTVPYDRDR